MQILSCVLDIFQFLLKRSDRQKTIKVKLKESRKAVSHVSKGQVMFPKQTSNSLWITYWCSTWSANHATVLKLLLSEPIIPQNDWKKPQNPDTKKKTNPHNPLTETRQRQRLHTNFKCNENQHFFLPLAGFLCIKPLLWIGRSPLFGMDCCYVAFILLLECW